jgi:hypothetical protein
MKFHVFYFVFAVMLLNLGCSEKECCDSIPKSLDCDQNIISNEGWYNIGLLDPSTIINDVNIDENCLDISFSYSGGCTEHQIYLVWNGLPPSQLNPQISIRVKHDNMDLCEAYITESISYDLNSIMESSFTFKIEGWDEIFNYEN